MGTKDRFSPGVMGVCVFTLAYLAAAVVGAFRGGNVEFIFYIAVMAVLIGAVFWVHARIRLTTGVLGCLSVWGLLHMAGGLVPVPEGWPYDGEHAVLYSLWLVPESWTGGLFALKYDQAVHAFGFGVTTWLCWQGLRAAIAGSAPEGARDGDVDVARRRVRPTFGLLVLCVAAGMGFGALNEIVEFAATRITETNVGGYVNTGWDLVSNAVGSGVAAVLIRWRWSRTG